LPPPLPVCEETATSEPFAGTDAPLFFAHAAVLRDQVVRLVDAADPPVRTVVLDAEGMVDLDISGAETLTALLDDLDERGARLVRARVRSSLRTTLRRLDLEDRLGARNIHLSVRGAVAGATVQAAEPSPVPPPRRTEDSPREGEDGSGLPVDASGTDR